MNGIAKLAFKTGTIIKMLVKDDFVVQSLQKGEVWETLELSLWEHECSLLQSDSGLVLDIGAYTGIYSLLAAANLASVGNVTHVQAFEPLPAVHQRLVYNIALNNFNTNGSVSTSHYALSNEECESFLNITGGSPLPSGSSVGPHPDRAVIKRVPIHRARGDALFNDKKVALMKIDAERHELPVLLGFSNVMRRDKPVVFMEILDASEAFNIHRLMKEYGYSSVEQICEDLQEIRNGDTIIDPEPHRTNYIFRP